MRVNREDFVEALRWISPGVSAKESLEQSSCAIFLGNRVFAYDGEVAVSCRSPLPEIEGAVQAGPLLAILSKMPDEEVDVELGDGELLIKGKGRSCGVRMEAKVLLKLDDVERPESWTPLPTNFAEALELVEGGAGKDQSQFEMCCIHLHPEWIEAGDTFQFTRYRVATGFREAALVRQSSVRHILTMAMTKFAETSAWLHFRNKAGLVLSCRRYVQDYPDVSADYKVDGSRLLLPKGLKAATELAEVFSAENVDSNLVTVTLKPGSCRVRGLGASGWYTETKKLPDYKGPPLKFQISPKVLANLVTTHNECIVGTDRLAVDTGNYCYVTALGSVDNEPSKGS